MVILSHRLFYKALNTFYFIEALTIALCGLKMEVVRSDNVISISSYRNKKKEKNSVYRKVKEQYKDNY